MNETLVLEHLALSRLGATVTLGVTASQSVCVVGPAASGKTHLIQVLAGRERPERGKAIAKGSVALCGPVSVGRRVRAQALAQSGAAPNRAALATEVLTATGLWNDRQRTLDELSPSQLAACELLEALTTKPDAILIDGQLERLDPWALMTTLHLLKARMAAGACVVAATHRIDLVRHFDVAIVLKDRQVRYVGRTQDLVRSTSESEITVATERQRGVRALVKPFKVQVSESPEGLKLTAAEGQQLAARLLVEGYGDVEWVVLKSPTPEEAIIRLIEAPVRR